MESDPEWGHVDGIYRIKQLTAQSVRCQNILQTLWVVLKSDLPVQTGVFFSTLRLIRRLRINVVCIGELQELGWLGVLLGLTTAVKVIYYTHGEELTTKSTSRFYGKNARFYLHRADGIVTVSHYTMNKITEIFNIPVNKIKLITNGIDIEHYVTSLIPDNSSDALNEPGCALLFSVGRLIRRKGFDKAIDAMAIVHTVHPDVQLIIAGEGELQHELKARIKALNLAGVVKMLGRVSHDELVDLYQRCDIFLMPNRELENGDTEGFGLVFLEANAFKKPVIGGNAGGAVDAIVSGETGLLVDGHSADDIAGAIIKLLENNALRTEMGENGYRWAKENDVKNKVCEFLEYCECVVAQN